MSDRKIHQGRNIKKFREMLGIKQEALALDLGDDWSQKKVSQLEAKETIDEAILGQVAHILRIPKETLENLDVQEAIVNIQNNSDSSSNNNQGTQIINPTEEWMKALEENKKLYERLLQSEREKVEMLERLLKEK